MAVDISQWNIPKKVNLAPVRAPINTNTQGYNTLTRQSTNTRPGVLGTATAAPWGMAGGDLPPGPPPGYYGTGGGGGGGAIQSAAPAGGGGDQGPSEADLAYQIWRSSVDQANRLRSSGEATIAELLKSVGSFRDRAKEQFTNAGQQITNAISEGMGTAARTADELGGETRARGRAIGLGDSSKFSRQNKVRANLASTQGSYIANKGENDRANTLDLKRNNDQADTQENQVNQYRRDINDSAAGVESAGVANYGSQLSNLINYQRQLAQINPLQAGSLTQRAPDLSGVQNSLNGLMAAQASRNIPGGDMGAGNLAAPTDYLSQLRKQRGIYA